MTAPEKANVKWGLLFAVCGGILGFAGTIAALSVQAGTIVGKVDTTVAVSEDHEKRIKAIEVNLAVMEQQIKDELHHINEKLDRK